MNKLFQFNESVSIIILVNGTFIYIILSNPEFFQIGAEVAYFRALAVYWSAATLFGAEVAYFGAPAVDWSVSCYTFGGRGGIFWGTCCILVSNGSVLSSGWTAGGPTHFL